MGQGAARTTLDLIVVAVKILAERRVGAVEAAGGVPAENSEGLRPMLNRFDLPTEPIHAWQARMVAKDQVRA